MHAPIVQAITRGLLASGVATKAVVETPAYSANHSAWRPRLTASDIFVWLGEPLGNAAPIVDLLRELTQRGVFTVVYNAEELDRPRNGLDRGGYFNGCLRLLSMTVTQVWDFSMGNVAHCQAWRRRQPRFQLAVPTGGGEGQNHDRLRALHLHFSDGLSHRYVPPGYVPRAQLARLRSGATPKLVFFGGAHRWYTHRTGCLHSIRHGLTRLLRNVSSAALPQSLGGAIPPNCYERWCDPRITTCARRSCHADHPRLMAS